MKVREAKSILKHVEGMSSDDEVTEMESSMFKNQRGTCVAVKLVFLSAMF